MQRLFLLATLSFLLAGCAGPAAPTQQPTSHVPTTTGPAVDYGIAWRPGDYWVQRAYYEDMPEETVATLDYYVQDTERVNGHDTIRIVSSDDQRIQWIRASDGALVRESINGNQEDYEPPCQGFLGQPNASLQHACFRAGTRIPQSTLRPNATLATTSNGTSSVSVPAGEFDVIQLDTRDDFGRVVVELYAPNACFPARAAVAEGNRTVVLDLVTFSCENAG